MNTATLYIYKYDIKIVDRNYLKLLVKVDWSNPPWFSATIFQIILWKYELVIIDNKECIVSNVYPKIDHTVVTVVLYKMVIMTLSITKIDLVVFLRLIITQSLNSRLGGLLDLPIWLFVLMSCYDVPQKH